MCSCRGFLATRVLPSSGWTLEHDAMGIVQNSIADGVGHGRVAKVVVPFRRGQLAGDDGGAKAVAIFQQLEQIAALLLFRWRDRPIVQHQQIDAGELLQKRDVRAIGMRQSQIFEEARRATVKGAVNCDRLRRNLRRPDVRTMER